MMNRNVNIQKSTDWTSVILFLVIAIIGWITIYSASYVPSDNTLGFFQTLLKTQYGKQGMWMLISAIIAVVICNVEGRVFEVLAIPGYVVSTLLIFVTIALAIGTNGADAWINIGPFKLQPCEFMKLFTCLVLAQYLGRHDFKNTNFKDIFISGAIVAFPILIILLQKDTGSALVFLFLSFVLYRAGVLSGILILVVTLTSFSAIASLRFGSMDIIIIVWTLAMLSLALFRQWKPLIFVSIITAAAALLFLISDLFYFKPHGFNFWTINADTEGVDADAFFIKAIAIQGAILILPILGMAITYLIKRQNRIVFIAFLIMACSTAALLSQIAINYMPNHQQKRIHLFLGMIDDPKGVGWDSHQIEIAIGSGGLTGKGFLKSTQVRNKFISEESTDFIFCTIGEEHGFLGSSFVVLLYLTLLIRIIIMAERQRSRFSMYYGYGVALVLFSHIFINLGMQLKLLPIIGIPLPLISYGGSSCMAFTILFFIFIRLDSERQKMRR